MFRTALRNVLAHKTRLLMTVLAVMLGVAFVSGTLVFTNSISQAYEKSSAKGFATVDVSVRPAWQEDKAHDEQTKLTTDSLDRARETEGAAFAIGSVTSSVALADKDGNPVGDGWQVSGGNYWGTDDPRYPMAEGNAPKGGDEVAIDSKTAARHGYQVGDKVRMSVDGPVLTPTVSGIFTTDDGSVEAGGSLTLFDTATAQKLLGKPGEYDEITVKAEPGVSQNALMDALGTSLPKGTVEMQTGAELAAEQAMFTAQSMDSLKQTLLVAAGISLFVGTFLIANTFTMLVAQRTKELALMRAVGASRRQVTRSVLFEAFVVGTVAAVTGLVAGIGIGAGLRTLLNSFGANFPQGPLVITPGTVVAALAVGVLITMLAAWLPGRRAAKIPPVAAMNSLHAKATTKSLVLRNTIGSLFTAAGVAVVLAATSMDDAQSAQGPLALGAALIVIGVFVLTPLLSRPLIAAAAPVLRVFGVSGKLARQNAVRNPRRTAATASALMIGLTLITAMTVAAVGVQSAINKMASDSLKADYVVSMANFGYLSPDVADKLAGVEGVTDSSPMRSGSATVDDVDESLTGVSGSAFGKLADLPVQDGNAEIGGTRVVVDEPTAEAHGWKPGSEFTVTYDDDQQQKLTVAGVYQHNELFRGIMLDLPTLAPHVEDAADTQVMVKMTDGTSDAAKDSLQKALGDSPAIKVQDKQDLSDEIAKMITMMLNILYGLLGMAVIVAVLGVVNTLAMSVFERAQEIGMLRAIGLDRKGIKRMVRLESLVISLFGAVLGIGLGVFFGWAAGELVGAQVETYELVLPWGRIAVFLLLAAVVGVLAALWPARRAARLNMLTAIKSE
ncbi:ABC transporter permease [Streptomyces sp. NPDC057245]|uniref:ABC transporter permease n=1 Tax=Streptomyces TaxID=1883 RepID=UPI001C1E1D0F|nr:FtsX-like permease family protein [Streptomyces sp. A108]MBU6534942.1 ABC transporter permease [Streptomyces sp. A108]